MTHSETAKRLRCSFRIGRYGFKLFGHKLGGGRELISMVPLDGWVFDPQGIVEAVANDPGFSIKQDKGVK